MHSSKLHYLIFLFFAFTFSLQAQLQYVERDLPTPAAFDCTDGRIYPNEILYGAAPTNSEDLPVLVFVHGYIDNGYGWFFQSNKMYHNSFGENYRTVFLGHSRTRGIHENAVTISGMLAQIAARYEGAELVVVAHSKGGLDTEMAMIEYGANDLVKAVISLSTPYQGVPISDIYGLPIITPIIDNFPFLGHLIQQEGTSNLQTAYMQGVVRPYLDNHANNAPEKFITLGGKGKYRRPTIPDWVAFDIPNLVFYSMPVCTPLPVGNIDEFLIQAFFSIVGGLTDILPTSIYTHGGNQNNDGIIPYYSSLRPNGFEFTDLNASSADYNHFEAFYAQRNWGNIAAILNDLDEIIESNEGLKQTAEKVNYSSTLYSSLDVKKDGSTINEILEGRFETERRQPSIKADFHFDATKTFDLAQHKGVFIEVEHLDQALLNKAFVTFQPTIDLKGRAVTNPKAIELPLTQQGNRYVLESMPNNLSSGIYTATIEFQKPKSTSYLATSVVLKNERLTPIDHATFKVYPNPTADYLQFNAEFIGSQIIVYSLNGRQLLQQELQSTKMDVRALPKGIYLLQLKDVLGNFQQAKFVKQ